MECFILSMLTYFRPRKKLLKNLNFQNVYVIYVAYTKKTFLLCLCISKFFIKYFKGFKDFMNNFNNC